VAASAATDVGATISTALSVFIVLSPLPEMSGESRLDSVTLEKSSAHWKYRFHVPGIS
jgi:hypothetical protein